MSGVGAGPWLSLTGEDGRVVAFRRLVSVREQG
jgi:hypothetical protein